jgi:putative ABC transport system substrate-binding protein
MKRREFITFLGSAAAWPLIANAQQPGKVFRVGVLWHAANAEEEEVYLSVLRKALNNLGYIEGRNIELIHRFPAEQPERFRQLAVELVNEKVDVLIGVNSQAALPLKRSTNTIPIVFVVVPDPVGLGLAESLSRPGGNATGLSSMITDLSGKYLELLRDILGSVESVALLVNPNNPVLHNRTVALTTAAASSVGIKVHVIDAGAREDLPRAFSAIGPLRVNGVVVGVDAMLFNERRRIAELALAHSLPTIVTIGEMVPDGALLSYGPDFPALFRRAAFYVDRILKGANPADLPVEQPTTLRMAINLKTAKALGIEIPPTLLARADEVIE